MSVFKFNWIVLFFMLLNCYDCRQSFDREPEERQVNPGDDAVMICRILDKHRNSQCIWQKDGKPVRIQVRHINRVEKRGIVFNIVKFFN